MCGIVGFWSCSGGASIEICEKMAVQMRHRGPDDSGVWLDKEAGIALAHRRLSIIDLSPAGHQPMVSPCGRYSLVYNGEIYNHQDLRNDLDKLGAGFDWRGHSDTEILLASICYWGIEQTLKRLNGMFAFALWDTVEKTLFLARDRMGEKPLYYGSSGDTFLFGSELKALSAHPNWCGEVDRDALALYMRHNYVPTPWSIYKGIYKLQPAHFVVIKENGRVVSEPKCYWDLAKITEQGSTIPLGGVEQLTVELDELLRDAVKRRMTADVPLGVLLSGGYDSTMVTALMQSQSSRPVKTFSIGFHESSFNEAQHAKAVAAHLGTEHTELYVTPEDSMAIIPMLPTIWDEPFSDSSQIPMLLISEMTRQRVTVCLSGDGGDELFCGYNRYLLGHRLWQKLRLLPPIMRRALSYGLDRAPAHQLNRLQGLLPKRLQVSSLPDRLPKLAEVLANSDGQTFYRQLVSHWKDPEQLVLGSTEPQTLLNRPQDMPKLSDLREQMMYMDTKTYLPDDILTKVDRASMAASLEVRVPLLDHRLVEFAWRVPMEFKYRHGQGKWLLRQVLYRYVPKKLMERPKMGFGVPIEQWLRGPLREWAEELISEHRLKQEGYLNPKPIRTMWNEHMSGKRRWHYQLWDVLMYQAWLDTIK